MDDVNELAAPRPRTPRALVRERVLRAAAVVFAEHGFAEASIDEVAAAAGFTKGAVYSNFTSKDELFFALMDQQVAARAELARQLIAQLPAGGDLAHVLGAELTAAMQTNRDWQLLFFEYWQRAMRHPPTRERFVAHRRELRTLLASEVQRLLDAAGIDTASSAESITLLILGMSNGLAIEELLDPGCVPPELFGDVLSAQLTPRR
jgi:AcrR family transcriptional regulator